MAKITDTTLAEQEIKTSTKSSTTLEDSSKAKITLTQKSETESIGTEGAIIALKRAFTVLIVRMNPSLQTTKGTQFIQPNPDHTYLLPEPFPTGRYKLTVDKKRKAVQVVETEMDTLLARTPISDDFLQKYTDSYDNYIVNTKPILQSEFIKFSENFAKKNAVSEFYE